MAVRALVDTGAVNLCIPAHVALQLELEEPAGLRPTKNPPSPDGQRMQPDCEAKPRSRKLERREVTTADGNSTLVPYVGPIQVRFENRSCFVGAFVLGQNVLLGSIPLEDMDLVLNPRLEKVTVNPDSPNIPSALVCVTAV